MQPGLDVVLPGRKSKDPAVTQLSLLPGLYLFPGVCDVGRKASVVNLEISLGGSAFCQDLRSICLFLVQLPPAH